MSNEPKQPFKRNDYGACGENGGGDMTDKTPTQRAEKALREAQESLTDLMVHLANGLPTEPIRREATLTLAKRLVDEHRTAISRAVLAAALAGGDAVSRAVETAKIGEYDERDRICRILVEAATNERDRLRRELDAMDKESA